MQILFAITDLEEEGRFSSVNTGREMNLSIWEKGEPNNLNNASVHENAQHQLLMHNAQLLIIYAQLPMHNAQLLVILCTTPDAQRTTPGCPTPNFGCKRTTLRCMS